MRKAIKNFAAFLDGSEAAKNTLAIMQIGMAASAFLYTAVNQGFWQELWKYLFMVLAIVLLIHACIMLLFYKRYDLNVLYCQKETGMLFDKNMHFANVSLRRKTMQILLNDCAACSSSSSTPCLTDAGIKIGKDFVVCFRDEMRTRRKGDLTNKQTLEKILRYDSSSGMGRFDLEDYNIEGKDPHIQIKVRNPFTEENTNSTINPFLLSYLSGVCSEIYQDKFTGSVENSRHEGSDNIFVIKLKKG